MGKGKILGRDKGVRGELGGKGKIPGRDKGVRGELGDKGKIPGRDKERIGRRRQTEKCPLARTRQRWTRFYT